MNVAAFIDYLKGLDSYQDQVVHVEHIPETNGQPGELAKPLPPSLIQALSSWGMLPLYSHQAAAIDLVRQGHNIVVSTPAASGKSLCYNIPVAEALLQDRTCRALYLFPTKALAQDQMRGLERLRQAVDFSYATFDGDTPREERARIRKNVQVVLTNPDMLHLGILPNHQSWARLLRRLRYVVTDEAHAYRGVFGSHVGDVLRRLRRLCAHYGSSPQFICSSATLANPQEHAERLVGLPFQAVTEDGSARGGRDFAFWDPPFIDEAHSARRSSNSEATALLAELVRHGIRSLVFANTRKLTELIYIYSRNRLTEIDRSLAERIMPYRAGYLPEARRAIERALFQGELLGVVATSALEMGIDIGDMDATVLVGYPGSIASTWQQAGRSGRRRHQALSILIGRDGPLDQYFMRHPEALFGKSFENALCDPSNRHILGPHLLSAAWELPLEAGDEAIFGPGYAKTAAELEAQGLLKRRGQRLYPAPSLSYPAQDINIRSASTENYTVVDVSRGNQPLETVDASVAFFQIHQGAIYLHQGEAYLISKLDLTGRTAYAVPSDATYYTQAKDLIDLTILNTSQERRLGDIGVYLGQVEVTTRVLGFRRKQQFTEDVISEEPLDLPAQSFPTVALWFDLPQPVMEDIEQAGLDLAGGLHAAEHAAIGMLPLFALCDRNDIGGLSTPLHPDTGRAQIFIYDAHPGSIGIAEKGFQVMIELWRATLDAIVGCPCQEGCPSCVQSPKCGNNNQPLDKEAAKKLLAGLLAASPPAPATPTV